MFHGGSGLYAKMTPASTVLTETVPAFSSMLKTLGFSIRSTKMKGSKKVTYSVAQLYRVCLGMHKAYIWYAAPQ